MVIWFGLIFFGNDFRVDTCRFRRYRHLFYSLRRGVQGGVLVVWIEYDYGIFGFVCKLLNYDVCRVGFSYAVNSTDECVFAEQVSVYKVVELLIGCFLVQRLQSRFFPNKGVAA